MDSVITVSETSKKDIVRFLNLPATKIHTIYNAPLPVFRKEDDRSKLNRVARKYRLSNKFVFYLGDVYYSKNIPNLVRACEIAKTPLVIVGKQVKDIENNLATDLKKINGPRDWVRFLLNKPHPEQAHYMNLKTLLTNNKNVYRLGYVPDEDLVAIMNLATVYCQPSLYEGFGLGVVHAFACGTPVVISRTQALSEVADKAALIADPRDPEDIASNIRILLEDAPLRAEFIKRGYERLKNFSWEKNAKETIKVYEKIDSS
jgi:glycosyltransferase involved in cell wall biosynthesis